MKDLTKPASEEYQYQSTMSRRESLKWLSILTASAIFPNIASGDVIHSSANAVKGHWPELKLSPVMAKGYGKDPNLIIPHSSPWPKILTAGQLTLVAVLADIIVPRDGNVPSATEVNVPDVINEWMSAPYAWQQADRLTIHSALVWINDESTIRFSKSFIKLSSKQQIEIIDNIAYQKQDLAEEFIKIANAFSRLRKLVLAAFFCSPAGTKDLGYQGNAPIMGDYPGPTDEAMEHLNQKLAELGLSL